VGKHDLDVVLLVGFVTMQELGRVLGKGRLKCMFFGPMRTPAVEERNAQSFGHSLCDSSFTVHFLLHRFSHFDLDYSRLR
jgi:hypothetical protein